MNKKKIILIITISIIIIIFIILGIIYKDQKVAILGYHSFIKEEDRIKQNVTDNMVLNLETFEKQLKFLKINNYKTLTLEEFYCFHQGTCKIPRKSVLITMDDGYQSNYDLAFSLLEKYDMHAVVFYLGINETGENKTFMDIDTINKIYKKYPNIEIASHSYNLHEKGAINQEKKLLEKDIKKMKKIVNSKYYAYPFGEYNDDMLEALKENDYKMAFTFGPGKEHRKATKNDDKYLIPRLNISNDMPLWKFILRILLP